jgi:ABC-2 type transport system permease protein
MGFSFLRIYAVLAKEFTQLTRDRVTYAMILVLPIVQLMLFGFAINNDPHHLPAAILVQDQGNLARSVVSSMEHTTYVDVVAEPHTASEMDAMVRRGEVLVALTIPPDFTHRVLRHDHAQVLAEVDASDPTSAAGALAALAALPTQALSADLKGPAAPAATAAPFEVVTHRLYNPENLTALNIVPGLVGVILSMTLVMMTAMAVVREYERGTMESLLSTPATPLEVMVGKLSPYVLVGLIQTVVVLTLARGLFSVPMPETFGGWLTLACGVLVFIVASLSLGYFISTMAKSQLQAMQMSFFYMLPSILLSGFAFPFQGMPTWARTIGEVLPVTHFVRIVRGALLKQQTLADAAGNMAALIAFVLVIATIALSRARRTMD